MSNASQQMAHPDSSAVAGEIKTLRFGQFSLIDVPELKPSVCSAVGEAILREWALSPTGVMARISCPAEADAASVRAVAGAGDLVHRWPGTPIGVIAESSSLRDQLAHDPMGRYLRLGPTIPAVWPRMWVEGIASSLTMELIPALRASEDARSAATRACLDWGLAPMIPKVSPLIGRMVRRSVLEGAGDLHLSLSQHRTRIRIVVEDDAPRPPQDADPQKARRLALAPSAAEPCASRGEFNVGSRHFAWAVCEPRGHGLSSSGGDKRRTPVA